MDTLSWVPVPSTVTSLPPAPVVVDNTPTQWRGFIETVGSSPQAALNAAFPNPQSGDGVQDETSLDVWKHNGSLWVNIGSDIGPRVTFDFLIPLYNEALICEGGTATGLAVQSFSYSLALLQTVALTTRTGITGVAALPMPVPSVNLQLAALAPSVVIVGVELAVPAVDIEIGGIAPVVLTAVVVATPAGLVTIAGLAPIFTTAGPVNVPVPAADLSVVALAPTVSANPGGPGVDGDGLAFWRDWAFQDEDVLLFGEEEASESSGFAPWSGWSWSEDGAALMRDE